MRPIVCHPGLYGIPGGARHGDFSAGRGTPTPTISGSTATALAQRLVVIAASTALPQEAYADGPGAVSDMQYPSVQLLPNPKPLMPPGTLPGFHLVSSLIHVSSDPILNVITEQWQSDQPADVARNIYINIKLELYSRASYRKALKAAKLYYLATTEPNQTPSFGKPVPGSYSGQPIGDICWAYSYSLIPDREHWNSKCLIVIKNFNVLKIGMGNVATGVPDAAIESVALKVVAAVANRKAPGSGGDDNGDDDGQGDQNEDHGNVHPR